MNTNQFIFENIKPFKKIIALQLFAITLWAFDLSFRPFLLKIIIDRINTATDHQIDHLFWPAALYIGMSFLIVLTFRLYDYAWLKLNPPLKRQIGDQLMQRMMQHSQDLFNNHFAGALATKVKDVMSHVPDLLKVIVTSFYGNLAALLIAIVAMSLVHKEFALMLIVWVLVFLYGSFCFSRRAKALSDKAADVRSTVVGRIVDILGNMMSVRLFNGAPFESLNLKKHLNDYVLADQTRDWYFLKLFAFQGFSFVIYQSASLIWLIHNFKLGSVTAGDFVMILTINIAIISTLWKISEDVSKCADYLGNISQGLRIALSPIEIKDKPFAKELQVTKGEIVFNHVEFHYKDTHLLFEKKSVTILPGQKVGLVGYSGSGKSTFVNLILRLYDVTSGQILIDGQAIDDVTQSSLHKAISMIPQDPSLFHRSLKENISYGNPYATEEMIIEAAKKAHVHDFIMKLPEGYESLVGERGVKLSGGQRQRIAIARAILKNAPILILDEATCALDSVTESDIQESLWDLMQGKTTIAIAHRLSTLLHMDRILVLSQGQIIQDGKHKELILQNGLYKTLWDTQTGDFIY